MPIWKHERVTCCVTEMNECDRRSSCTRRQKDFNESIMNKMIIRSFVQIDSIQIRSFVHSHSFRLIRSFRWLILRADSFIHSHSSLHSEKHPRAGLREIQTFLFYMMTSQITYSSQTAFARALLQVQSTLVLLLVVRDSSLHWLLCSRRSSLGTCAWVLRIDCR